MHHVQYHNHKSYNNNTAINSKYIKHKYWQSITWILMLNSNFGIMTVTVMSLHVNVHVNILWICCKILLLTQLHNHDHHLYIRNPHCLHMKKHCWNCSDSHIKIKISYTLANNYRNQQFISSFFKSIHIMRDWSMLLDHYIYLYEL